MKVEIITDVLIYSNRISHPPRWRILYLNFADFNDFDFRQLKSLGYLVEFFCLILCSVVSVVTNRRTGGHLN